MSKCILAVDPSLRCTGYTILEKNRQELSCLVASVIKNKPTLSQAECLLAIYSQLNQIIISYTPSVCVLEKIIYVQSHATAISLGATRGIVLLVAAQYHLPIYEYSPTRIKKSAIGYGSATKEQISFMMKAIFGLSEVPSTDATDAMAIGLTHLNISDVMIS